MGFGHVGRKLLPLISWMMALGVAVLLAGCATTPVQTAEGEAFVPPPGGDFSLHALGGPVSLHDFRGKVVLLFFGYTHCPDVCPTSLALLSRALNSLNEAELAQVQPLFVTLDPERDGVEELAEFVAYFHPKFIGLTGSSQEIAAVAKRYGVKYYRVEEEGVPGYAVNHSAAVYLVTKEGKLRFLFPHGTSPALIAKGMRYLVAQ